MPADPDLHFWLHVEVLLVEVLQTTIFHLLQDEFQFYMEDAGSKLLVVGRPGCAAAEAAAAALGPLPVLGLSVEHGDGSAPVLALELKAVGASFKLAEMQAGVALANPPQGSDVALFLHTRSVCDGCSAVERRCCLTACIHVTTSAAATARNPHAHAHTRTLHPPFALAAAPQGGPRVCR